MGAKNPFEGWDVIQNYSRVHVIEACQYHQAIGGGLTLPASMGEAFIRRATCCASLLSTLHTVCVYNYR